MEESKMKYYSLAKYLNREVFLESQLQSAGANQSRLLEKFEKKKNSLRNQTIAMKIIYAFLLAFISIIPLFTYLEIINGGGDTQFSTEIVFLASDLLFSLFFIISMLYTLLLGLMYVSSFMSGKIFEWLRTLPISRKNLKKLGFTTIFRGFDIPMITMVVFFPIIMLFITQNPLTFLICLITSFLNIIFSFSILIIVGERVSRVFNNMDIKSKKAKIAQIITMLGYFIVAFGTGFVLQFAIRAIEDLIYQFANYEHILSLNIILNLIPYPFAPSSLISASLLLGQVPLELVISSLIGYGLFILLTWGVYKVALSSLRSIIAGDINGKKARATTVIPVEKIQVEIKTISPIKSYIRKDLTLASRDFQTLMFFIMPVLMPIIMILSMNLPIQKEVSSPQSIMILWAIVLVFCIFIPSMLVVGFLNLEESGATTIASLPIVPRDQAKAKLIMMSVIQSLSFIVIAILLTAITSSILVLGIFLVSLPIAWIFLFLMFEMKIRFFGKMKFKYTIDELYKENKIKKWLLIYAIQFGLYFLILIVSFTLFNTVGMESTILVLLIMGLVGVTCVIYTFAKMFPKVINMHEYETGGALRKNPLLGIVVLAILYIAVPQIIVIPLVLPIVFLLENISLPFIFLMLIDFFLSFLSLLVLWFIIVPFGLKLPNGKESFREFAKTIRLSTVQPLGRNILLGIFYTAIFCGCALCGALFLGEYVFDLSLILGTPTPENYYGLLTRGWILFVNMLIPGIWEEIAFRGVILTLLLKKYSKKKAIIIDGVAFGLFHLTNIIFLPGVDPYVVMMQAIYAGLMGISLAYMYVATESLLPCIIAHYLIDVFAGLFANVVIVDPIVASVYLIVFFGIIPAIFNILLVKFIKQRKKPIKT
ncbi:MAG: CPBP family glutamic-type intramembrane protease [Promethearchaeota archaeon]